MNFIAHKLYFNNTLASLVTQTEKNLLAMQETRVRSLGLEDPLEEGTAAHSNILVWKNPWREEPGGLQSMSSQRVGHDQATNTYLLNTCRKRIQIVRCDLPEHWLTVTCTHRMQPHSFISCFLFSKYGALYPFICNSPPLLTTHLLLPYLRYVTSSLWKNALFKLYSTCIEEQ